jgi:hypothetical protein
MVAELQSDIKDLKSRMVALETLSTTAPKVPPREEEGRAKGHREDNDFQGGDAGGFPHLTVGKGEYKPLKTDPFQDIHESSHARGIFTVSQHHEPKDFKLPKLDFPKFDGEHPQVWREKCEKYFSMYNIPVHVWVPFASINFRSNAELWLQTYEPQHTIGSWPELCVAVDQFGRDLHHNYMRDLLTIRQTSDVLESAARFEQAKHRVLVHNRDMGEVLFVQKFIDGLRYNISSAIVLHKPRTVDAALSLTLMQDEILETSSRRYQPRSGREFTRFPPRNGSTNSADTIAPTQDNKQLLRFTEKDKGEDKIASLSVTPAFLAPNKSPNKSCVFSKLSSRAQLPPFKPSHCPSLSPRRAYRESRPHRPHPGQHPRVPSQRRGRPPSRESRARRGPRRPVRLAITVVP